MRNKAGGVSRRLRFWVGLLVVLCVPLMACALYYRSLAPERSGLMILVHPAVLAGLLCAVLGWGRQPPSSRLRAGSLGLFLAALVYAVATL